MLKKVKLLSLIVLDQDAALEFYTQQFGFKVHTDEKMADGFRWLTICLPNDCEFEIALIPAVTEEERDIVGNQGGDTPFFYINTDDCDADFQLLRRHSVEVVQEPTDQPWGRDCLVADLYGNVIGLCQEKK